MRSTGLAKPFASRWLAAVDVTASIVCLNAPMKVRHSDTYIERGKASFAGARLARFAIFLPVREERLRDEPNRKSVCEAKAKRRTAWPYFLEHFLLLPFCVTRNCQKTA